MILISIAPYSVTMYFVNGDISVQILVNTRLHHYTIKPTSLIVTNVIYFLFVILNAFLYLLGIVRFFKSFMFIFLIRFSIGHLSF